MRHLFITGSSRGIGKPITQAACDSGLYQVTGFARGEGIRHPAYDHVSLDLSDTDALDHYAFPPLPDGLEQIVLINNAGSIGQVGHVGNFDARLIEETVRINLTAPMVLSNAFVSAYGHYPCPRLLVHISTGAATSAYDGWSMYCSTKAGLDMYARVQEKEFALRNDPWPFMVRAIAPGVVETAMQQTLRAADDAGFSQKDKFIALHEQGHLSDATAVGQQYLAIINGLAAAPDSYPELISRIPPLP